MRAHSLSLSKNERGCAAAPGAGIARTTPPPFTTFRNALNVTSSRANTADTSAITSGLRRSGLSLPYFSIASKNGMRGKVSVTGLPSANSTKVSRITGSMVVKTSSCVTKLISTSSW